MCITHFNWNHSYTGFTPAPSVCCLTLSTTHFPRRHPAHPSHPSWRQNTHEYDDIVFVNVANSARDMAGTHLLCSKRAIVPAANKRQQFRRFGCISRWAPPWQPRSINRLPRSGFAHTPCQKRVFNVTHLGSAVIRVEFVPLGLISRPTLHRDAPRLWPRRAFNEVDGKSVRLQIAQVVFLLCVYFRKVKGICWHSKAKITRSEDVEDIVCSFSTIFAERVFFYENGTLSENKQKYMHLLSELNFDKTK